MTRFLSDALVAQEPEFRLGLRQLEAANGNPSTDIRLTTEISRSSKDKLRGLGLDPNDTTASELYHALQQRVADDDKRLTRKLRTEAATHISAEADVVAGMIYTIKQLPDSKRCFALKSSSLKALLKSLPPKKAMKQLGYRSLDSFLKHEPAFLALAAAWLCDGEAWQKHLLDKYKKLTPSDFESRNVSLIEPVSKHWRELAERVVNERKNTIISFKEVGAIILLPLTDNDVPTGAVTASLALALHELNEIRACSTFLKLYQVRPEFGRAVQDIASDEPHLSSKLLDQPMPWNLVQRYYARLSDHFREAVFEPYIQLEDMSWYPIEDTLAKIDPHLRFWQRSAHLGVLDATEKPVSLNILDAALNYCNHLPFEQRVAHYFQRSLWHELLLRYLHHEPVEQAVLHELQPALAEELAVA